MYAEETPTPCPEIKRMTRITAIFQLVVLIVSLYVAFKVYGATKSMWKAFGTWFGIGLVSFSIMIAYVGNEAKKHPCVMDGPTA